MIAPIEIDGTVPTRDLVRVLRVPPDSTRCLPESVLWRAFIELRRRGEPGVGEQFMQAFGGERLVQGLAAQGLPQAYAQETANQIDEEMKTCILALYRSATHAADDWFADLRKVTAPALILWGEKDPYAAPRFGERLATNVRGRFIQIDGAGHWYQVEQPAIVAHHLEAFWSA